MNKKTIAVIFGGQSSEHKISILSALNILENINKDNYDIVIIGITKEGRWLFVNHVEEIRSGEWVNSNKMAILIPDALLKGILLMEGGHVDLLKVDVIFPVLHGLYGEDGTIQGLMDLAKIPYVGCGRIASGIAMDKFFTKAIVNQLHIRQASYVPVLRKDLEEIDIVLNRVETQLSYPVFVKPSNAGSSKGVSKAENREQLKDALFSAAKHDNKILVEETIVGREIECAVLGGDEPKASGVGEILAAGVFYDYDAKYHSEDSKTVISPNLPEGVEETIRESAIKIFKAIDGYGLSRVDFFVEKDTNEVVFNEINTMPGFTGISMYPMLWEEKGINKEQLIETLINLALEKEEN